jgi:DNA-binding MurR/RpiR family transcriptional regulator
MFREQIRKHYDHLSRSYRRVADFILSDYRTAAFMTAAALADAVDVDTTTVVRFAQRLGYPGFPELIEDIQDQVKLELSQTYATPAEEGGLHAKVQALVAKDRANLEKALAHNTLDTLENILDMLRAAPRIIVMGESYAAPIAESFAGMLREAGLPVTFAGGDVYARAAALGRVVRKEVIIGMTPVEGPSGVARVLRYARSEGALTLACTPSLSSQAARAAEHLLYAPGETESALPSLTGLYALCTAIAQTLATLQAEASAKRALEVAHALEALS